VLENGEEVRRAHHNGINKCKLSKIIHIYVCIDYNNDNNVVKRDGMFPEILWLPHCNINY